MTETQKRVKVYNRPQLVVDPLNGRTSLTKAVWNNDTMAQYVMTNGVMSWIKVGDLARIVWGRSTEAFRKDVRRRLPNLKRHLALQHNQLLVAEYNDPRGSASAVKIYDPAVAGDVQAMKRMLSDMDARKDRLLGYYTRVTGLSGIQLDD